MKRVVVVGSINQDISVSVDRLPGAGETIHGTDVIFTQGGKGANQAISAARSGGKVEFVGAVGDDPPGLRLIQDIQAEGIACSISIVRGVATGTALIIVESNGENRIIVAGGANLHSGAHAQYVQLSLGSGDIVLLQNEIPMDTNIAIAKAAHSSGARVIYNPAPMSGVVPKQLLDAISVVVVNETEAVQLLGAPPEAGLSITDPSLVDAISRLVGGEQAVLTIGARGAWLASKVGTEFIQGHPVQAIDTTGAGDCFVGAMAAELAVGAELNAACRFANQSAALSVTRRGAGRSFPKRGEVVRAMKADR